jgi:hypothetical protein
MLAASVLAIPSTVSAQVVGTFRWQFAPFCNTVTLLVEQKGAAYILTGTDNLCGAPVSAPATGTAHMNPNGTVTLGITVVRPDGLAVNHSAQLALPSVDGTWTDNFGNSGTLIFSPSANPPGAPRPATRRGNYAIEIDVNLTVPGTVHAASAFSYGMTLATPPVAHLLLPGHTPTAECPGTALNPEAAPGHLCVYTSVRRRARDACITSTSGATQCNPFTRFDVADRFGAAVVLFSVFGPDPAAPDPNQVSLVGTWAVTAPQ